MSDAEVRFAPAADRDSFQEVAVLVAVCLAEWSSWVHRRVESVVFVDDSTIRRRVSVDVSLSGLPISPQDSTSRLLPLALLRKQPLVGLDVCDDSGRPLPVLTTFENGSLAASVLVEVARVLMGDASPIEDALDRIARLPGPDAQRSLEAVREQVAPTGAGGPQRVTSLDFLWSLCESFAENFLLVVPVAIEGPERRVVKFSYVDDTVETNAPTIRSRVSRSLGWEPRPYEMPLPAAHLAQSYHFEVALPDGVLVQEAVFLGRAAPEADPAVDDLRVLDVAPPGLGRVHLHAPTVRDSTASVLIAIRISRVGWLRTALMVTAGVAVFMFASAWRLPALLSHGETRQPVPVVIVDDDLSQVPAIEAPGPPRVWEGDGVVTTDVAALLMALVAVLVAVVVRAGEHPLTSRFVTAVRLITVASALLPMGAAWALAFGPTGPGLRVFWWLLAAASLIPVAVACKAYRVNTIVTPAAYDPEGTEAN